MLEHARQRGPAQTFPLVVCTVHFHSAGLLGQHVATQPSPPLLLLQSLPSIQGGGASGNGGGLDAGADKRPAFGVETTAKMGDEGGERDAAGRRRYADGPAGLPNAVEHPRAAWASSMGKKKKKKKKVLRMMKPTTFWALVWALAFFFMSRLYSTILLSLHLQLQLRSAVGASLGGAVQRLCVQVTRMGKKSAALWMSHDFP